jgi:hypothetical protein
MSISERPLQPLRIPSNWQVTYNEFREIDPADAKAAAYLREDLFQAFNRLTKILIDVGWYPDGDPEGGYVLSAHRDDFHGEELLRREARTRGAIVEAIEDALLQFQPA